MAGSSLFMLIDDIATLLDDVAAMTKLAAKKTAGVLGDDLALNAQQVSGIRAERELPVVWAVAVGSLRNKALLVPLALAIGALLPWLITPLLMLGGAFLCFEGAEKLVHNYLHAAEEEQEHSERLDALQNPDIDMVAFERDKIKSAITTDFILSAEIIAIALGTVAGQPFATQLTVLVGVAVLMTIGVYGLVAGIVKLDDIGLYFSTKPLAITRYVGRMLLNAAPPLMRLLSLAGTIAVFLVGGGILAHGIAPLHHAIEASAHALPALGPLAGLLPAVLNGLFGLLSGLLLVVLMSLFARLRGK
ncbi:DUF808 domain-containing protein [Vogesella sp. LIG4]|uniref:DUF808 domain-containing protein n=1 Tax=Vogesella sp. LIG4 TaxID=1192162 RepID=UPI00081FD338|nr:DUF808 domain-containing protein [Vogesella sp. LIG4]SCK26311.1 hypothetical protein PSELUDRAFT_3159 [Vogesella sp. LIG4]